MGASMLLRDRQCVAGRGGVLVRVFEGKACLFRAESVRPSCRSIQRDLG